MRAGKAGQSGRQRAGRPDDTPNRVTTGPDRASRGGERRRRVPRQASRAPVRRSGAAPGPRGRRNRAQPGRGAPRRVLRAVLAGLNMARNATSGHETGIKAGHAAAVRERVAGGAAGPSETGAAASTSRSSRAGRSRGRQKGRMDANRRATLLTIVRPRRVVPDDCYRSTFCARRTQIVIGASIKLREAVQSPEQVASDYGEPYWEYRLYNDYVEGLERTVLRIGEALKVRGPADRQALDDAMQRRLSENAD